jgi:two-component system osmolarity sensor histidine kinase EnvZ
MMEIIVSDDGIGMSPDLLTRATLPTERGVSSSEFSGTGFGLSIVNLLVGAHEGAISISSTEDEGTKVKIMFPL